MQDEFATFSLTHTIARSLHDEEEYECLICVPGKICVETEDSETRLAGRTSSYIVDYARAKYDEGLTLHDVLDADMIAYSYAAGLLGDDGDLHQDLQDMLVVERILIIDRIEVLPEFRGRRLGIWALYRILDCFALSNVLPVIMPFPLQFGPSADASSRADLELGNFKGTRSEAFGKIRNYWAQVGFEKAWGDGEEQLWILNPTYQQPDRRDVLGEFYDPQF